MSKSVNNVCKLLQLLKVFVLHTAYRGFGLGPRWGTPVPLTPWPVAPNYKFLTLPLVLTLSQTVSYATIHSD